MQALVRLLVDHDPELIPAAAQCLYQNRSQAEYADTGALKPDDVPGIAAERVLAYNERMADFYAVMPHQDEHAGLLRGEAFEALVTEVYRAHCQRPEWEVHRDTQVYLDEQLLEVRNTWDTGDREWARSCDLVAWPSSGRSDASWFVSCKISARQFIELDLAYLYRVRAALGHSPNIAVATTVWPSGSVATVMGRWYSAVGEEEPNRALVPQTIAAKSLMLLCRQGLTALAQKQVTQLPSLTAPEAHTPT